MATGDDGVCREFVDLHKSAFFDVLQVVHLTMQEPYSADFDRFGFFWNI